MKGKQLFLFGFNKDGAQARPRYKVIFHFDTLILLGVIVILLLTVSFSLGVEKGKKFILTRLQVPQDILENTPTPAEKLEENVLIELQPEQQAQEDLAPQLNLKVENAKAESDRQNIQNQYNIQVASFRKENTAQKAAESLKESGYPVLIMRKGNYAVVYVGSFDNEEEARSNFEILREKYTDCILRRL